MLDACEVCKQEQTACYTIKYIVMGQANRCNIFEKAYSFCNFEYATENAIQCILRKKIARY